VRVENSLGLEKYKEYAEEQIINILSVISDVAIGDFEVQVKPEREDIFGALAIGVNEMISHLKRLWEEKEKAMEEVRRVNKELEDLVYIMSHDLKAPLRAITGFSSFLLEDYGDKLDEEGRDYLNRLVKAAKHMEALINDLLEYSRIERIKRPYKWVDLKEIVEKAIEFVQPPDNVRISYPENMPELYMDDVKMQQVFINLIANGIKYNDKEEIRIEIGFEEKDDEFKIWVKDNGIGIDEKYYEDIFKIFKRLHTQEEREGTGIGLSIVRKIITQHQGRIWVESQKGKGSCFYFTIPKRRKDGKKDRHTFG